MNKKTLNVAIIGAGLNGLSSALSLRMFGINATVYEKSDKQRVELAAITLWPEGMQVLAALTDASKVQAVGNTNEFITTSTFSGEIINQISMRNMGSKVNADIGTFHCRDLYQLLLDAYGEENIVTGQHCTVENNTISCLVPTIRYTLNFKKKQMQSSSIKNFSLRLLMNNVRLIGLNNEKALYRTTTTISPHYCGK